jgi:hypothetical protein
MLKIYPLPVLNKIIMQLLKPFLSQAPSLVYYGHFAPFARAGRATCTSHVCN